MKAHIERAVRCFGSFVCLKPIPAIADDESSQLGELAASGEPVVRRLGVEPAAEPEPRTHELKIFNAESRTAPPPDEVRRARCA
jgi:hypothetical protein